eukprot:jgi/Orpsp1_1/1183829/evm.model.c7180000086878.1
MKHFIIQENIDYHNGHFVEDNKFNYNFGESEIKPLREVKEILKDDLTSVNYIVGQSIKNEIRELEKLGIDIVKFKNGIIDTQDLFIERFHVRQPISLKKGLERFFVPYKNLHNA